LGLILIAALQLAEVAPVFAKLLAWRVCVE